MPIFSISEMALQAAFHGMHTREPDVLTKLFTEKFHHEDRMVITSFPADISSVGKQDSVSIPAKYTDGSEE